MHKKRLLILALTCLPILLSPLGWAEKYSYNWTIEDLLNLERRPFAVGYRGYGENLGENSARPLENTAEAVRKAFRKGVSMVDVDVVVTADGQPVLLRSDFLQDYSCINALTYEQLKQREHQVPTLKQVLRIAKEYSQESATLSGLINLDLKAPSPLCDAYDISESLLVHSVIEAVHLTDTTEQVIVESSSPSMLTLASNLSPTIAKSLNLNTLQLLDYDQIETVSGYAPTRLNKQTGFGLQWAEIGPLYRIPLYKNIEQAAFTAYLADTSFITVTDHLLDHIETSTQLGAQAWIEKISKTGVQIIMHAADTKREWNNARFLGIDGVQTNNVEMAIDKQHGRESW